MPQWWAAVLKLRLRPRAASAYLPLPSEMRYASGRNLWKTGEMMCLWMALLTCSAGCHTGQMSGHGTQGRTCICEYRAFPMACMGGIMF